MRVVEASDPAGLTRAVFAAYPFPVQTLNMRALVGSLKEHYPRVDLLFIVATDETLGWTSNARSVFRASTRQLLSRYTKRPSDVGTASEDLLAALVRAWLSDLATHWKSRARSAPGERELVRLGLVSMLRAGVQTVA